jgi:ribose-phosphate pyrophosphokinase
MPPPILIPGTAHPQLAEDIADYLNLPLCDRLVDRFNDGEIRVEIHDDIRGADVFLIQPTSRPANDHIMELMILADAARRSSAERVTAVIPYFGYARQDRTTAKQGPITAKLVANILDESGIDRIVTMDLHTGQIEGFFDIPVDHLLASRMFADDIQSRFKKQEITILSPDIGGVARARSTARRCHAPLGVVDKRRIAPGKSATEHLVGRIDGRYAIIIDDMVDTGGTLIQAAEAAINDGAVGVSAYVTHRILSDGVFARLGNSPIDHLFITDSMPRRDHEKITYLTIAPLLGQTISRIHQHGG